MYCLGLDVCNSAKRAFGLQDFRVFLSGCSRDEEEEQCIFHAGHERKKPRHKGEKADNGSQTITAGRYTGIDHDHKSHNGSQACSDDSC